MQDSSQIVRALAFAAAVCYVLALAVRPPWARDARRWRVARGLWTSGYVVFALHVTSAFALVHHWSHAAAYQHTAQRTLELTGVQWGGGLYLNYLFTAVWLADVLWWSISPLTYLNRSRRIEAFVQLFLAFMFFNGVIVFGGRRTRWLTGLLIVLIVAFIACRRSAHVRRFSNFGRGKH